MSATVKRRCGVVALPPDTELARCYPSHPQAECFRCARYRSGRTPRRRKLPVIDASIVTPSGDPCPMQVQRCPASK